MKKQMNRKLALTPETVLRLTKGGETQTLTSPNTWDDGCTYVTCTCTKAI